MPPHRVYIEPFLGSGAVLRMKRPAAVNIGVELDPLVLGRWALPVNVTAEAFAGGSDGAVPVFSAASDADAGSAGATRSGLELGPANLAACDRDLAAPANWAATEGAGISDGGALELGPANLAACDRGFEFRAGDGIEFLRSHRFQGDELVYCDPPYMRSTRSGGRLYACEMTDAQHSALLRVLRRLPCMVMVSGYWSELYGRQLATWRRIEYEVMTRGGLATEQIWMNFPAPLRLHDYRYLGKDRREREDLKRMKGRWVARLARMPELQRHALLSAIADASVSAGASG